LKKIDRLPTGPDWKCDIVTITGNIVDENGVYLEESVEVWRRDPVECVKELMGNPAFKDYMAYTPEHAYLDEGGKVRIYDKMWTADWWWNTQVSVFNIYV
jgi:Plavaka transposase